jgi:hypothetical protein
MIASNLAHLVRQLFFLWHNIWLHLHLIKSKKFWKQDFFPLGLVQTQLSLETDLKWLLSDYFMVFIYAIKGE